MGIYSQDGVNVNLGDLASKEAAKCCKETYGFSPIADVIDITFGNFRGPRGIQLKPEFNSTGCIWSCAPDGIGTKVVITDSVSFHQKSAFDLMAMTSFDLVRWGGIPIYMTSVLDVSSLGKDVSSNEFQSTLQLYNGLKDAAKETGIVVLNGETAELSSLVSSDNPFASLKYNWGGSVHGLYHPDRMITGQDIEEGQVIIVFKENGFRSNGISSVRKAFVMKFGDYWFNNPEAIQYLTQAATPSVLYDKVFVEANGWLGNPRIDIKGLIHLTGGSFESKLGDLLFPNGFSAELYDLWDLPEIMRLCADWRDMKDKDLYETWNGGQGALAIVDEADAPKLLALAKKHNIEAKEGGRIYKGRRKEIVINSKFNGKTVTFGG